jgi:hypothetical protein
MGGDFRGLNHQAVGSVNAKRVPGLSAGVALTPLGSGA